LDKIIVTGGERLVGEISVSGSKNSALPILASTLLSKGDHTLSNVPNLVDVKTILKLLQGLGAKVVSEQDTCTVSSSSITHCEAPYELVKTMRASILVLGPLVARFREARVSLPGGCAIGARPINLHLMGLEKMGAEVRIEHGYVKVKAKKGLHGAKIPLDIPTVTGTENLMMAAVLADGTTVIDNAAREPEILDLAQFLVKRGARIRGAGTETITIEGVTRLDGGEYAIMPDRIEAGTFLIAGAITGGDLYVKKVPYHTVQALVGKLTESGVEVKEGADGLHVRVSGRVKAVDIKTMPYPGFPTDMQAQMMSLMAISSSLSVITETIFESRFTHVSELKRMGADIKVQGNHAIVQGVKRLSGAPVMASDLRASACLILAGLAAEGETEISRIYHLDRGYERIEMRLSQLGARICRVKDHS